MTDRHTQSTEAIQNAWDFWLSQHDVSVPDRIEAAVRDATAAWLRVNTGELLDRIAAEVAKRIPPAPGDDDPANGVPDEA